MALILRGKTRCALCKEVLEKKQEIRAFPPFVANRLDPLYVLNDAAVHKACFHNFELGERAVEILHRVRLLFENRSCIICEQMLDSPVELFTTGYLSASGDLAAFNFIQMHQTCIAEWTDRVAFEAALDAALAEASFENEYTVRYFKRSLGQPAETPP